MFRLGEEYFTKAGYKARIICVDAEYKINGKVCTVIALLTLPPNISSAGQMCYFYTEDGKLTGVGSPAHDLISNEPNEEEAKLIEQMLDFGRDPNYKDAKGDLLKIIRQLRRPS
jgi:hypothetical protein